MPREEKVWVFSSKWFFFPDIFSVTVNLTFVIWIIVNFLIVLKSSVEAIEELQALISLVFSVTTTLNLFVTYFSWSWQGQVTWENEEILLPEPFPGTKISCQVNLLGLTHTMVMVILFRKRRKCWNCSPGFRNRIENQ